MPLPATYTAPDFVTLHGRELAAMLNAQRDPLCTHLLLLIVGHSDFKTGWFLGSYARLQELCTPPAPERGPRRAGPTLKMVRDALERLVAAGVLWRDASNLHNKQLKLRVWPRDVQAASAELTVSYQGRAEKAAYRAFTRVPRVRKTETGQETGQGYQQLTSISPTPQKNGSYPQSEAKTKALRAIGELLEGLPRRERKQSPASGGRDRTP